MSGHVTDSGSDEMSFRLQLITGTTIAQVPIAHPSAYRGCWRL